MAYARSSPTPVRLPRTTGFWLNITGQRIRVDDNSRSIQDFIARDRRWTGPRIKVRGEKSNERTLAKRADGRNVGIRIPLVIDRVVRSRLSRPLALVVNCGSAQLRSV